VPLKKGTGSELTCANTAEKTCCEVPVPISPRRYREPASHRRKLKTSPVPPLWQGIASHFYAKLPFWGIATESSFRYTALVSYFTKDVRVDIDPGSHVPIYLQIADAVRAAVAAGVYRPGDVLPSLRAMATDVHVNPNTVQRAYDELEREGLIYSQRGRGLFVADCGAAVAQSGAGDGVRRALDEAIRAGRASGMTAAQIREVFRAALDRRT
jgi:GntR family transcriptional regulator